MPQVTQPGTERQIRTDFDPLLELISRYDLPDPSCRIQVTGTNGKGTTLYRLARTLLHRGIRTVGLLSPHLHHPRERFLVNGVFAEKDSVEEILATVQSRHPELTQFERHVAATMVLADQINPDFLLLEAGLGGRWDGTSALASHWLLHTGVEVEHTEYLGETLPEILEEQIIQLPEGGTVISRRDLSPECQDLLSRVVADVQGQSHLVPPGSEPLINELSQRHPDIDSSDRPLPTPELPGRFERRSVRSSQPVCRLDVAHTPGAVRELVRRLTTISTTNSGWTIIYGGNRDKLHGQMRQVLHESLHVKRWIYPELSGERTVSPADLNAGNFSGLTRVSVDGALKRAQRLGHPILVTGGFAVVSAVRDVMRG